jgi:MFS family permease
MRHWHKASARLACAAGAKLWRDRVIALGSFSGFTGGVVMMSINGFLPLYVQGAMGRSPTAAGMALGAASVSWTFASLAAGRLMIRTSYRRAAMIGGVSLIAGTAVLITLGPASHLLWAAAGSLLIGIGMGFCNTAFLVSTQASAGFDQRGMATSSIMFMRIVGNSVGAAVFGAILNFEVGRRISHAGDAVNRLLQPAARQGLGTAEIARLSEVIAGGLHNVYVVAGAVAIVSLMLAWALPARLSPTRPAENARAAP